jgi:CheY-like chemotaxis protein
MLEDPNKRYQFLFVDDDPAFLTTLTGLLKQISKAHWAFRTATNASQALEHLKAQPVDLVVLDIEMPVMDGIEFLRLLQRTNPGLRVVMLSARLDEGARKTCMELGATLYLEKPSSPDGFQALFAALDALVVAGPAPSGFRGMMQVGLQDVLQMECLGRKSSVLTVSAGNRRGQIFISEGEIVHAECGKLQGEMALYGLLGLSGGEFNQQPYTEPQRRSISGHYEFLLMEAARLRDENNVQTPPPGALGGGADLPGSFGESATATEARGLRIEETLLCSRAGEVLYQSKCESLEQRLELFKNLEEQAVQAAKGTPSGRFHRVSVDIGPSRIVVQIQPSYKLLVRSALPAGSQVLQANHE